MSTSPVAPHHRVSALTGRTSFFNPWASAYLPSFADLFRGPWLSRPMHELEGIVEDVKVVEPDWGRRELRRRARERKRGALALDNDNGDDHVGNDDDDVICGTWVGHAGAFVEIPLGPAPTSASTSSSSSSSCRPTLKLLFDPMFSSRASPVTWFGPKRMREAPCPVEDLPGVDMVLISHNHYDHLDLATILAVHAKWPRALYCVGLGNAPWFVARGIPAHQVREMDWWEEVVFPTSLFLAKSTTRRRRLPHAEEADEEVWVTCVPAQHTSGRSLIDQRKTLWCGWVVERLVRVTAATSPASSSPLAQSSSRTTLRTSSLPSSSSAAALEPTLDPFDDSYGVDYGARARRALGEGDLEVRAAFEHPPANWIRRGSVYHAGDTGCRPFAGSPLTSPVFPALGAEYGPFDLSFIPIWRGGTLGFISALGLRLCQENLPTATHASPTDAVQIHLDVRSRNTVGIHFGTFQGSHLEALEALHELEGACDEAGVRDLGDEKEGKQGRMGRVDIGETLVVSVRPQMVDV